MIDVHKVLFSFMCLDNPEELSRYNLRNIILKHRKLSSSLRNYYLLEFESSSVSLGFSRVPSLASSNIFNRENYWISRREEPIHASYLVRMKTTMNEKTIKEVTERRISSLALLFHQILRDRKMRDKNDYSLSSSLL